MTPAVSGLIYAASADFRHATEAPFVHHFARFFVALGLGVTLFLSAGQASDTTSSNAVQTVRPA